MVKGFAGIGLVMIAVASWQQQDAGDAETQQLTAKTTDPIAKLQQQIDSGAVKLKFEQPNGYLRSVLQQLHISSASQMLVFSKTSLQSSHISPTAPRALYFDDNCYVGWVNGGQYLEIASFDPIHGPIFYTLANEPQKKPTFKRRNDECLQCHSTAQTKRVPGLVMRSVYTSADGYPRFGDGSYLTTSKSPIKERWGGWYVTGKHGSQRHMGNVTATGEEGQSTLDTERGANVTDLRPYLDVSQYLTPHSDIVALLVAEHQANLQNLITKTSYLCRNALRDELLYKEQEPKGQHSASTNSRIEHASEPLIEALLCSGETKFSEPIKGTSRFAEQYMSAGPKDKLGRSLRQLDLKTRLLKYPCSPTIYSPAFDALPSEARLYIYKRIRQILAIDNQEHKFSALTPEDKQSIVQILSETKPEFSH